jgi:arginyl-tRNA synthetase
MDLKSAVAKELAEALGLKNAEVEALLEIPPDEKLGDYALPCFAFAKELKKAPALIAQEFAARVNATISNSRGKLLLKAEVVGSYLNLFVHPAERAKAIIAAARSETFWGAPCGKRRILIEYPSPNTNKPLHLGHVRNMVLGSTLVILLKNDQNTVISVNLNNDRGIHICKSMLAYKKWGKGAKPEKKSDHFVGDFYVQFEQELQKDPALKDEAQEMLLAWENDDKEVRALWKLMNSWALDGFRQTYDRYHVSFDKEYFESGIYEEGKAIVEQHADVFARDETGALVAHLEQFGLPDKVVLRADGTSIYMTQDLALTLKKIKEFSPDEQVWVVANEQNLHFQQLFAILTLIGVAGETFRHLSYGMVALPEGRMKSREGRVVDADDLLDEMEELAAEEIGKRHEEWTREKIRSIAQSVAMAAIRFFILKYDPAKDFTFDPASSLSFEGDTGPYLQYTHARICSVIRKSEGLRSADAALLGAQEEQALLKALALLPAAYRSSIEYYKPSALAQQLLDVAHAFNTFYHALSVLKAAPELRDARLLLLEATRLALAHGLALLGIDAPEQM